jgi:hypothetical protein
VQYQQFKFGAIKKLNSFNALGWYQHVLVGITVLIGVCRLFATDPRMNQAKPARPCVQAFLLEKELCHD